MRKRLPAVCPRPPAGGRRKAGVGDASLPPLFIGTSGWNYDDWRESFYGGVPRKQWLAHCGRRFSGIEVNATFYRFMGREVMERWRDAVPDGFAFAVKGSRLVTHLHRLGDFSSLPDQRRAAAGLGAKLAVVLWQLPANFASDAARLRRFVRALERWPEPRHAIEFRHPSWFTGETAGILADAAIAACQSDSPEWPLWDRLTTDFVYARLHGHRRLYCSNYGEASLKSWARRIAGWRHRGRTVHVYFDNTDEGRAPRNAVRLRELCGQGKE